MVCCRGLQCPQCIDSSGQVLGGLPGVKEAGIEACCCNGRDCPQYPASRGSTQLEKYKEMWWIHPEKYDCFAKFLNLKKLVIRPEKYDCFAEFLNLKKLIIHSEKYDWFSKILNLNKWIYAENFDCFAKSLNLNKLQRLFQGFFQHYNAERIPEIVFVIYLINHIKGWFIITKETL